MILLCQPIANQRATMVDFPWLLTAFLIIVCLMFAFGKLIERRAARAKPPTCSKCGGETVHYCGMACVDMCPKCDRL